jgi:hypothetical protein
LRKGHDRARDARGPQDDGERKRTLHRKSKDKRRDSERIGEPERARREKRRGRRHHRGKSR